MTRRLQWRTFIRLASSLAVLLVAQPWLWAAVADRAAQVQERRQLRQQLAQAAEQLDQLQAADQHSAQQFSQLTTLAPPAEQLTALLGRLERAAAERNLGFELLTLVEEPADFAGLRQPLQAVSVTAQAVGTPEGLFGLLQTIEYGAELVLVTEWSLAATEDEVNHVLNLTLVYLLHGTANLQ